MSKSNKKKHVVHWFRKGLRLHDNPSLREALKGAATYRCVYILDPWFAGSSQVGINKWRLVINKLFLLGIFDNNVILIASWLSGIVYTVAPNLSLYVVPLFKNRSTAEDQCMRLIQ